MAVSLDELKKLKYCQKLAFGDEVYLASIVESLIEERDKRIAELENTVKDDRQKAAELIGHWISVALKKRDEIKKLNKSVQDLDVAKRSAEVVFQSLLDAGLIKEWYFNGQFQALLKSDDPHVELAHLKDEIKKKDEEIVALKKVIEMADAEYFKLKHWRDVREGQFEKQLGLAALDTLVEMSKPKDFKIKDSNDKESIENQKMLRGIK